MDTTLHSSIRCVLLGKPKGLNLAVSAQTGLAMLCADTRALHTSERDRWMMANKTIRPHGTALDLASDTLNGSMIRSPNGSSQTPL